MALMLVSGVFMVGRAQAAAEPDLHQYRGRARILLVFAPRADDPALLRQRAIFKDAEAGFQDRQLVFLEVIGTRAADSGLRHRFDVNGESFRAILIGKDGGAKLQSPTALSAQQLFATIDAMPMRRHEMQSER